MMRITSGPTVTVPASGSEVRLEFKEPGVVIVKPIEVTDEMVMRALDVLDAGASIDAYRMRDALKAALGTMIAYAPVFATSPESSGTTPSFGAVEPFVSTEPTEGADSRIRSSAGHSEGAWVRRVRTSAPETGGFGRVCDAWAFAGAAYADTSNVRKEVAR